MVANRKQFSVGAFMGTVFVLVLLVMFVPLFRGKMPLRWQMISSTPLPKDQPITWRS